MSTSNPCSPRPVRYHAFTLVELLTVIAIIGILAAIIIPTVGKVRQIARRAVCASNLRQIGIATFNFAADNKDWLPGYQRTDNSNGLDQTAKPKGYVGGGQLMVYLNSYLGGTGSSGLLMNRIFVCPANTMAVDQFATSSDQPLASWYIGLKARLTTSAVLKNAIGWSGNGSLSVKIMQLENPKAAVYLSDQDAELIEVGMKDLKNAVFPKSQYSHLLPPAAVHGNVRNVLYFDGHVQAVGKDVDPHEKL
ncbi:MAG: DUF1559 domain-containing protein [Opitutaceae bacterium]|jgi:prepilin-type N-terminal cleavage/methylation domain-containing protein/prepilin-type processing-associated H-X9-DG protein|nr:DUF1559 domain-containing protein [Opitutaceae bacterium]